ncbi:PAS domain S-box protein [Halobacterium litoreum]|uniref:histidine kinase n=1 Tax=Halobacterium litoreum TaxID=2039234 RepID=A0ABD5NCY2_9EURY|nr:PAS domain S-box protein [Halobacterium litoreum]UHH13967.1 PAS domain S-box protein [Halobacterium litoreum]
MTMGGGSSIRVLLVEDDDALADLTVEFLEREDDAFEVETRDAAESALDRLDDAAVDCVVSDHDMPGMNGLEFLGEVRDTHPELPFVLFTGKGSEEIASDAISAGVTDYLQKGTGTDQYTVLANRVRNAVEKRRSQQALREEKHLLEQVLATTPGSVVFDADGRVASATDRAKATLGLAGETLPVDPDWAFATLDGDPLPPEDHPARKVARTGQSLHGERLAVVWPDGWEKYLVMHCAPLFDEAGDVDRVVASFTDVTDRVEHEHEIERVQTVVQAVGDAVYTLDEDGVFTFVNDAFEELTGRKNLEGEHCSVVLTEDDIDEGERLIAGLVSGDDETAVLEIDADDWADDVEHVEAHIALLPYDVQFNGTAGVVRDVTERERRQRKLRESEEKYATVVEEASDAVLVAQDDRLKFANQQAASILDADPGDIEGTPVADVIAPEDRDTVVSRLRRRLDGDAPERRYEFTAQTVDGDRVPIEFSASTITYRGDPAVLAICRDVSDRRRRDRERRQYETIVETAPDGVFIVDENANYVSGNEQIARLTGYSQAELAEMSVTDLVAEGVFDPEVVPRYEDTVATLLSSRADDAKGKFEFHVYPRDGDDERVFECHLALRPHDGEFRGSIGVLRDVTERKRRERELEAQNERLDEFASVASHDLRSPLNVATGWLEQYRETRDDDALDRVEDSLYRMDEILEELLTLARSGTTARETTEVPLQVAAISAWDSVDTGEAVLGLDLEGVTVDAVRGRLQELLENLFRNAVEHAPARAARTRPDSAVADTGSELQIRVCPLTDREGFFVADDGTGIPECEREDVFEMGHTSTEDGTGFGLAIVENVAENHGWRVELTESEDGGARFEFETEPPESPTRNR